MREQMNAALRHLAAWKRGDDARSPQSETFERANHRRDADFARSETFRGINT